MNALLAQAAKTFWMPPQASTVADSVDFVFYYIYWTCVFFFVLINGLMFYFMVKYRRRSHDDEVGRITHSTPLEIAWSVLPSALLVLMFWWGFKGFIEMRTPPPNAMDIRVDAKKWNWTFIYPNGQDSDELHVPKGQPVRLVMTSQDVLHSCFIPAFRVKRDVVPGRYSEIWFEATQAGKYPLVCAEYCGTSHSDMISTVTVHPSQAEYDEWLRTANPLANPLFTDELKDEWFRDPEAFIKKYENDPALGVFVKKLKTPAMMGKDLYTKKGCAQCHSVDGRGKEAGLQGPTWQNLYGREEVFRDGSKTNADENYLRESIVDPNKRIVAGYDAIMPKSRLNDKEIDCLIAYIKTLKK